MCVASTVLVAGTSEVQAQRRYGRSRQQVQQMQFQESVPIVELPSASIEGDAFPAIDDVVPLVESPAEVPFEQPLESPPNESFFPEEVYNDPPQPALDQSFGQPQDRAQVSGPAPLYSTGSWFRNGSWYSQMDVVAWTRSETRDGDLDAGIGLGNPGRVNLLVQDFSASGDQFLFNDAVGHNFTPGARITVGQFLGRDAAGRDHTWDFTFLGLFNWEDSRTLISRAGGGLVAGFTGVNGGADMDALTAPFLGSDQVDVVYSADLNSGEFNYRIRTRPGRDQLAMQPNGNWVRHAVGSNMRSILAGFRVMSFNEQVDYGAITAGATTETETRLGSTGLNIPPPFPQDDIIDDAINGRYNVNADNDMVGFQLGGELEEKTDSFTFGARGKVGGLFNFVNRRKIINAVNRVRGTTILSQEDVPATDGAGNNVFDPITGEQEFDTVTTFALDPSTNNAAENLTDENLAFLAEVNLFGTYQLRPNLHFRAGYDIMFLSGLTLAPENLELVNGFGSLNTSGTVLLHGGSVGFEATW